MAEKLRRRPSSRPHSDRADISRVEGANEKPSAPLQPVCAYATWSSSHKVSSQSNEMPAAACSPAVFVNKTTSSESQSKSGTAKEHPRVDKKAKAKPAGGAKQRRAARRAAAATAAAAVAAEKRCAATQMQQGSSVHVVSREVEPEQSVPTAQQAAVPAEKKKVETKVEAMNENKKTKTDEKEIMPQAAIEAPAQNTQVTVEKTQIVEASADEQVLDEQLMKGTLVYCIRRAAVPYCKQVSDRKLIDWPIEKLYKVVMKDQEVMKNVLMQWLTQPAAQARALVTEAKLNELPINEILKLVVAVRSFQHKRQMALVLRCQDGTSVFIDRAGKMSVIDRIAYATLLKAGRARLAASVPIEKNMEDVVSETRVKRERQEVESEVEGDKKPDCAQRLDVRTQQGGALQSAGNRMRSSAFAKGNKMRMEDG